MKRLWRYTKRVLFATLIVVVALLSPVAYVETMCTGLEQPASYDALIAPEHHRPETRTLMTYPEWHIVHAYDDYASIIGKGDPHEFGYLQAIGGFWSSLCSLTLASAAHGEIDSDTKQMVYVIGLSFTAELLLKAAYEETLGRVFATIRGHERAPLDDVSAQHAASYAKFLQQVPWYEWNFREDLAELRNWSTGNLRDSERKFALGFEYSVKAAYADIIANAVAQVGQDELTLRMVVKDVGRALLDAEDEVTFIAERAEGLEIEAPRYRALTHLLQRLAQQGATFVEIAGNDDILYTVVSENAQMEGAIHSNALQGSESYRHLVLTKVPRLAAQLRSLQQYGLRLEHIHDY